MTVVDDTVLIDKKDGYAVVTLNDPDRRNVFTLAMSARIQELFDELEADESINAVIITGAGKGFCSGGHLDELLENPGPEGMHRIYAGFVRIANSRLCLLYTSPSPRDKRQSRMPSSA